MIVVLGGSLVESYTDREVGFFRRLGWKREQRIPRRELLREVLLGAPALLVLVVMVLGGQLVMLFGFLLYPGRAPVDRLVAATELGLAVTWIVYLIRLTPSPKGSGAELGAAWEKVIHALPQPGRSPVLHAPASGYD